MNKKSDLFAPVFNIVHGSTVDGWGVRTTVFLKGCPLRCLWCCNPEGQKKDRELKYTQEDCIGCGRCVDACPMNAISMSGGPTPKAVIDRSLCDNCFLCVEECFEKALDIFGKIYSVDELIQILKKDQSYFGTDGGVTIGGGEATIYPEFTLALIEKLKASHIHTALDTCGYILTKTGLKALAEVDLALYDIKGLDRDTHIRGTGVPNQVILRNLEYRDSLGKDIIIQLPIILGFTADWKNLEDTAKLLTKYKSVKRVDLIPFHRYSEIKYRQLGIPLPDLFMEDYPEEWAVPIRDMFQGYGLNTQIRG